MLELALQTLLVLDERLFRFCYAAAGGHFFSLMVVATVVGSGWTMLALVPLLIRADTRRWALALTLTLLVTAVVVFALKLAVGRARPPLALQGVQPLFGAPTDFSFPSGHAAGSFATAAFVGLVGIQHARMNPLRRRTVYLVSALTLILAIAVAYSRVYLGVHFPGDVLVGSLLGTGVGMAGAYSYGSHVSRRARHKSRGQLAPSDMAGAD